jgi:putative ABC transport system permease protein
MRAPLGFALPFVLLLAIGTALNAASLGALYALLWKPLPYATPEALVELRFDLRDAGMQVGLSHLLYQRLRADGSVFDGMVGSVAARPLHDEAGRPWALHRVTADFAEVLGVAPLRGRSLADTQPQPGRPALLLSEAAARARFGGADAALGRRLRLLDGDYEVLGVMPRGFSYPDAGVDGWIVYVPTAEEQTQDAMGGFGLFTVMGRLSTSGDIEAARARLERQLQESAEFARLRSSGAQVEPAVRAWSERYTAEHTDDLMLLQAAAGLLLIVVAANLGLLVLMRCLARRREFALRRALGARLSDLLRALLRELRLPIALGLGLGLALAPLFGHALDALGLLPSTLPDAQGQVWVGPVLAVLCMGAALLLSLSGSLPALRAAQRTTQQALTRSPRASRLHGALLMLQIGLALVLSGSAGLLLRSAALVEAQDLGFEPAGRVVTRIDLQDLGPAASTQDSLARSLLRLDEAMAALPGVQAATYTDAMPFGDAWFMSRVELPSGAQKVRSHGVGDGYFETLGMRLLRGRDFRSAAAETPGDAQRAHSANEVVIDARLAQRAFGQADPIGRSLRVFEDDTPQDRLVVGVVAPIKYRALDEDSSEAAMYVPLASPGAVHYRVHHVTGDPVAMAESIRKALLQVEPRALIGLHGPLEAVIARTLDGRRALLQLGMGISLCVLLLTAFGLYAALQVSVLERRAEFGVRLALGAAPLRVLMLVLRRCSSMLVGGLVLGLPIGLIAAQGLRANLFGISTADPLAWTTAVVCVACVTLAAGLAPAWRAARTPPRSALEGVD